MEKILKIGIIGCGGIANGKHMPALQKVDGVEMVEDTLQSKMEAILNQLTDLFEFGYILPSKIDQMLTLEK